MGEIGQELPVVKGALSYRLRNVQPDQSELHSEGDTGLRFVAIEQMRTTTGCLAMDLVDNPVGARQGLPSAG